MSVSNIIWELRDYGGRRSGIDRRYFSYSDHIPERRHAIDRRSYEERRSGQDRRDTEEPITALMEEKRLSAERRSEWD